MPRALLTRVLEAAYVRHAKVSASLSLLVVDDDEIRRMNNRHLGKDEVTDVLAFDDGDVDPDTGLLHLGDVAVSIDTARREAQARRVPIRDELTLYALHGMLHLLGMRDDTDRGRAEMMRVQKEELTRLGISCSE